MPRIRDAAILAADPARVAAARQRLDARRAAVGLPGARAVGLSWRSSNADFGDHKSVPLADWAPILQCPGVIFVSVQYGETGADIARAETEAGISVWQDAAVDPLRDMDAAAAQIASLDLVITVSNTAAHLAGGLGHPTWLLLPAPGHGLLWYWGIAGEDNRVYPSLRCIRQAAPGDWRPVISRVASELRSWVAGS